MDRGAIAIKTVRYQNFMAPIKQIRTAVFQQEQGVKLEFDGLDASAVHLLAYVEGKAIGTARIREIDVNTAKIERLAVLPEYRYQGIGKQLMHSALSTIVHQNKSTAIVHAQAYIAKLYQQLGFSIIGDEFTEAGISHVKMIKHF